MTVRVDAEVGVRVRRVALFVVAASLAGTPVLLRFGWSWSLANDVACAALVLAWLPWVRVGERWPAQPTMIVGTWLVLRTAMLPGAPAAAFLLDFVAGSLLVMISTNPARAAEGHRANRRA